MSSSHLLLWVPKPPITSKNSAHNCCRVVKILLKAAFSTKSYQCPGSPPQPVASHSVARERRAGLFLIHQALWFHLFHCIFSASPRVDWKEEGSGCLNLFPCYPPLTCLALALGPPLLPLGHLTRVSPEEALITDQLESSHPRCRRIVCVLSHLISISANFFCFCCSYNRLSQS